MLTLTKCVFVPMAEDETPGSPTFAVEGDQDGKAFKGEVSVELDGRDIEWQGTPSMPEMATWESPGHVLSDIVDEIAAKHPDLWKEAEEAHGF